MRKLVLVAGILALLAAACGGGATGTVGGGGTTTPTDTATAAPVTLQGPVNNEGTEDLTSQAMSIQFSIEADDFYFKPTFIKATPGASVNIEVENEGDTSHTFTIEDLDVDEQVAVGQKSETTFTLPSSGVVNFVCTIHVGQGMQGAFYFT